MENVLKHRDKYGIIYDLALFEMLKHRMGRWDTDTKNIHYQSINDN